MKAHAKNWMIIAPVIFLLPVLFSSCHEKGCTDPNALNFNSVADVDDGSCIVCQTIQTESGTAFAYLVDFNSSSSHFNDTVAKLYVRQIKDSYNNSACGANQCMIYFKIENLVSNTIDFTYQVQCSGNNIFFSIFRFVSIPSLETTIEESITANVSNPCGSLNTAFLSFNASGTIWYH